MNMYLLSSFYAPGTIEDTGDAAENKIDKNPFSHTSYITVGETENKQNEVNGIVC